MVDGKVRVKMKGFLEVFPGLHMTEHMTELLGLVEVEKVSMNRDRSSLRVFIVSPRLIHKKNIMDLERGIRDQLFAGKKLQIKIAEKYKLSGQYTPEKLLQAYRDSLLLELKHYSIVEYTMFRKAKFSFPQPDLLRMTIEDTMVNKEKAGELKRILEKVFHERCGLPAEIVFDYVEPVRAKASIERERYARQEAERMTARVAPILGLRPANADYGNNNTSESGQAPWEDGRESGHLSGNAASPGTGYGKENGIPGDGAGYAAAAPKTSPNAAKAAAAGKNGIKKGDWSAGGYHRKSDNPDVLYGRDFEDDFIQLDKIEGEIGEVTIRGKILDKDSRVLQRQDHFYFPSDRFYGYHHRQDVCG